MRLLGTLGILLASSFFFAESAWATHLESGSIMVGNTFNNPTFTSVTFQTAFDEIPVVVSLPTQEGGDPSDLRIKNVTTTGFEIVMVEPQRNDGPHVAMNVHYVAMEPGVLNLPDGTKIVAGFHDTLTQQAHPSVGVPTGWDNIPFGTSLSATPVILAELQTVNNEENNIPGRHSRPFLSAAVQSPTLSGFDLALERSQAAFGSVISNETIGWIAIPGNVSGQFQDDNFNNISWRSTITPNSVVGWSDNCLAYSFTGAAWPNARIVGTKTTRNDADGGWVRRCFLDDLTIGLTIDEDRSGDRERNHPAETVSLLAFSNSFHVEFEGKIDANKTVDLVNANDYSLPGTFVRYTISATSSGNTVIDEGSVEIIDVIPDNVEMVVSDMAGAGGGPVNFVNGSPSSGLSYSFAGLSSSTDSLSFSNDNGVSFGYVPTPGPSGADSAVTHIKIVPNGLFAAASSLGEPSFSVEFDVIIK